MSRTTGTILDSIRPALWRLQSSRFSAVATTAAAQDVRHLSPTVSSFDPTPAHSSRRASSETC